MKIGRRTRESNVICHDRMNMNVKTRATLIRLLRTEDSVPVKACWAPRTSLLRRLMSAPVWVRVKNAIGCRWMCSKTWERMS